MLPGHTGLKDVETRFRQRYLDLICTPKTREVFQVRTPGGRSPTVRHANLLSPEPISD
jgi:lysyl-tRNA synthetase class II